MAADNFAKSATAPALRECANGLRDAIRPVTLHLEDAVKQATEFNDTLNEARIEYFKIAMPITVASTFGFLDDAVTHAKKLIPTCESGSFASRASESIKVPGQARTFLERLQPIIPKE